MSRPSSAGRRTSRTRQVPFASAATSWGRQAAPRMRASCACRRRWSARGPDRARINPPSLGARMSEQTAPLAYAEFQRVDIRVGRVVDVQDFPEARKPAFKLKIDFGPEIGIKTSSAQARKYYS